ncbi:MAG: phenylalanine--tRNA ligase subunit beta [Acidobacteria bacterium]|nr:phenylalanine--tRNA ligase subunit beta [Acidobacteriota bacterium]MDA1233423.1 phenylalanine--tRNA ligase subunit beta [Acidobacteriota bacterium]
MRILRSWLEDFVELPESSEELGAALTMAGMAVDGVEQVDGETIFELDITSNRPDAMNHFGIAREVAAIFRRPLTPPRVEFPEDSRTVGEFARIEIEAADLCPRYVGRVLLGVEIKPSPDWLRRRLELCGTRPINNIADLTNYVLLELGHPTHAFDLDTLNERRIVVRRARADEEMRTLDGLDRKLSPADLVIADAYRPVALAGVMGGLETEISDRTKNVLIEAAWFHPGSIRRTARRFGMHTEASHRFERGADLEATVWAADRIAGLLGQLSPGVVLSGRIDAYPTQVQRPSVALRRARLAGMLGTTVPDEDVVDILSRLGFSPQPTADGWRTPLPSQRLDVEREIDLIEEVGRIYGFGKIASTLPPMAAAPAPKPFEDEEAAARETIRGLGYDEMVGYSFISEKDAERFGSGEPVRLRNAVSELMTVMRPSAAPTLLHAIAHNIRYGEESVRLAEFGRVYRGGSGTYQEPASLAMAATGSAREANLQEQSKAFGFYDLKSDVEALLGRYDFVHVDFDDRDVPDYYVPGRSASVRTDRGRVAIVGEVDPQICDELKVRQPVFLAEIELDKLYDAGLRRPQYRPLPRVPPVERDFSLLVPEGVPFAEIRTAIGLVDYLERFEPVEIFRGKQVPEGHYALLVRAVWQRETESFRDEEIQASAVAILDSLKTKLRITLRS